MSRSWTNYDGAQILWDNRNVRSPSVSFGQIRYQPGGYCGPRIQRDYQLVILHKGTCDVLVDDARHQLHPEFVYLFHPGHREHFRFSRVAETHHSWCAITPDFLPAALRLELDSVPMAGAPCSESLRHILSAAFLLRSGPTLVADRVVDSLGLALFSEYLDICHQAASVKGDDSVQRAILHMEQHFGDEDCLVATRDAAACSANTLIYKFEAATGLSPARYLWKLRTEKGIAMIGATGLTIAEIAYKCGFKNPFHFSRLVHQHCGQPPRELRRRAWEPNRRNRGVRRRGPQL